MFSIFGKQNRLCDGISRREILRVGGLGAFGLSLPFLTGQRRAQGDTAPATQTTKRAKSCIVLFLMGGPPQHSTWDPKPDAPKEVRGEFAPISTSVPGTQFCELLPNLSQMADRLAVLRAVSSNDNAHSSSGYYMMTGQPHAPMNFENANPGFPNDYPNLGSIVRKLVPERGSLPSSIRLPHRIFNTDGSVWPGQDAGFLGRSVEPWLLNCKPADPGFRVDELTLNAEISDHRLAGRRTLLEHVNQRLDAADQNGNRNGYGRLAEQAFNVLNSADSRQAFQLDLESAETRDLYGRNQFGQSVLLGRRLVEAGVSLVQVNWYRGPDEPSDAPCWDSHAREAQRLKTVLAPPADQAMAALIHDLEQRGMLDETLVVCMAEFGRTPRLNGAGGRDHWGHVYSVALAGGGIKGGVVHGASDAIGAYPAAGRVQPQDLTATIFHCLGLDPESEIHDTLGRPIPISRGNVIQQILA
eukprot:TRINITY_DN1008_c0_g2_i1.p1 TRINITY_DN1008_c0_g2~~TRINITY_DN1008_c0_g2_i1.p1  ORF type:complete len:470 (-),score=122.72 TRINITY_DN1008_c0_g2_i1:1709-3118(-)